jgi:hypothetical protein
MTLATIGDVAIKVLPEIARYVIPQITSWATDKAISSLNNTANNGDSMALPNLGSNPFNPGDATYNTNQADLATAQNVGAVAYGANTQLDRQNQLTREQLDDLETRTRNQQMFNANMGNSAANANYARGSAGAAQQALNNVYQNAAGNLNAALQNSGNLINNAVAQTANLFR